VDTEDYGQYRGFRIDASGVAFEVFVTEILSRDPEIELVSASLRGGGARETAAYGTSFVAVRRGRTLLIEARAVTPQTSRRLEEQNRHLKDAARVYMERHPHELEPGVVLACPGVLRQSKRPAAAQQNLEIWDGPYLSARAGELDIPVPPGITPGDEAEPETGVRPGSAVGGHPAWHCRLACLREVLRRPAELPVRPSAEPADPAEPRRAAREPARLRPAQLRD
jgi:hypothetical protein